MTRRYFGTDGIRGTVGQSPITADFMLKLGWAAGQVLRREKGRTRVLIGKDTRISGYMFESALEAGAFSRRCGCFPVRADAHAWDRLSHTYLPGGCGHCDFSFS